MKLLLTSEGITNTSILHTLKNLLNKPCNDSRIVHVPTAANGEPGDDKEWIQTQIDGFRQCEFSAVDVVDISQVKRDFWLPMFEHADIISFGGGNTVYLLEQLHKTGVRDELPRLLQTRVYVGISAGSMVTAKNMSLTDEGLLYYDVGTHEGKTKGLGFVDFEIRPHLNDPYFKNVRLDFLETRAKENPTPFYAIDDNSAVVVHDDTISVVSEGVWKKFN